MDTGEPPEMNTFLLIHRSAVCELKFIKARVDAQVSQCLWSYTVDAAAEIAGFKTSLYVKFFAQIGAGAAMGRFQGFTSS